MTAIAADISLSQVTQAACDPFLYLFDPFITNLVTPPYFPKQHLPQRSQIHPSQRYMRVTQRRVYSDGVDEIGLDDANIGKSTFNQFVIVLAWILRRFQYEQSAKKRQSVKKIPYLQDYYVPVYSCCASFKSYQMILYYILIQIMDYLKGILGYKKTQLDQLIANTKPIPAAIYEVADQKRLKKFNNIIVTVNKDKQDYRLHIENVEDDQQEFNLPIHQNMNMVVFSNVHEGVEKACFEWMLENIPNSKIYGIKMLIQYKVTFKKLVCLAIKETLTNKESVADYMGLVKELPGMPVYKKKPQQNTAKFSNLNHVLTTQAQSESSKLAYTGKLFYESDGSKKLINQEVVFVIKNNGNFEYALVVFDGNGKIIEQKMVDRYMNYSIDIKNSLIKWLDIRENASSLIVEVVFDKFDVALTIKFVLNQCFYQINTHQLMKDAIQEDQKKYLQQMELEPQPMSNSIVKVYQGPESFEADQKKTKTYQNVKITHGLQKFEGKRTMTQAKNQDYTLISLSDKLEVLILDENNEFKQAIEMNSIKDLDGKPVIPEKIILHDKDTKAMIAAQDKNLYYYDMNESKIVEEYTPSNKGLKDITAEKKLAELGDYKTFVGIDDKSIFRIDPRIGKTGVAESKTYATNPEFTKVVTNSKGNIAIGSETGEIRFFKEEVGKNASNKFPAVGDPVLHLENTTDGKWLLATYKKYLILLPTFAGDKDLYENKIKIQDRPKPRKLTIKVEHLALCKIKELSLLPAKFDERKQGAESYIVSGFGEYVVVWSLNNLMKGNTDYTFMKTDEKLDVAEFKFDDPHRLLMTTSKKVKVQESRVKSS